MNKPRRELLEKLNTRLDKLKCDLELIRDEEQEYIDNTPEGLQGGERAENAEIAVSNMDDAINNLEEAASSIEESTQ
jgi:hypothetical protein